MSFGGCGELEDLTSRVRYLGPIVSHRVLWEVLYHGVCKCYINMMAMKMLIV